MPLFIYWFVAKYLEKLAWPGWTSLLLVDAAIFIFWPKANCRGHIARECQLSVQHNFRVFQFSHLLPRAAKLRPLVVHATGCWSCLRTFSSWCFFVFAR